MPEIKVKLHDILDNLIAYLEFEVDEGRGATCIARNILREFSKTSVHARVDVVHLRMREIASQIAQCTRCPLWQTRTKVVPGQGSLHPEVVFVGEAPGEEEDRAGLAFVGKAGQLLTRMIQAMGYSREEVFIGNILKCRPPNNRTPYPTEMAACLPFLREQLRLLQPKVIVALGATAVRGLLNLSEGITRIRGRWLKYEGIDLMPTYHPSYLLRTPEAKREAWEDLKAVLTRLGRKLPRDT